MKWRDISEEEVRTVLANPEMVIDSIRGRKKATRTIGEKSLEVVYKEEENRVVIITAIDRTR